MDINQAVTAIEAFLEKFRADNADWGATEIRVLPSGDENDVIKVWVNFGPDADGDDVEARADRAITALKAAQPQIDQAFKLSVRADAM